MRSTKPTRRCFDTGPATSKRTALKKLEPESRQKKRNLSHVCSEVRNPVHVSLSLKYTRGRGRPGRPGLWGLRALNFGPDRKFRTSSRKPSIFTRIFCISWQHGAWSLWHGNGTHVATLCDALRRSASLRLGSIGSWFCKGKIFSFSLKAARSTSLRASQSRAHAESGTHARTRHALRTRRHRRPRPSVLAPAPNCSSAPPSPGGSVTVCHCDGCSAPRGSSEMGARACFFNICTSANRKVLFLGPRVGPIQKALRHAACSRRGWNNLSPRSQETDRTGRGML